MMRKFLGLFSVNDPGWGNSHNSGSKDAKDGQGSDQAPKVDPDTNKPTETAPTNSPTKPGGPPDLDELWRDFNDRIAGMFGGKKKPGSGNATSKPANKPNVGDIPPPSQRGGQGGGGGLGGTPDPGSPAGKSGSGNPSKAGRFTTGGRTSSKSAGKGMFDGVELRVTGLDPAQRAFLVTGGSGRYSG